MARVKFGGIELNAEPIRQIDTDTWEMRAMQHTGRTAPGTIITVSVSKNEILSMAAAEMPPSAVVQSATDLEVGMAKERETLPSPAALIAQARADKTSAPNTMPPTANPAVSVPTGPM